MAHTQRLPSGKFRGAFRVGGRKGKQYTKTFDYEFEAMQWALDGERRARAVAAPTSAADTNHDETPAGNGAATVTNLAVAPAVAQVTVAEYGKRWLDRTWGERTVESNKWSRTQLKAISAAPIGKMPIGAVRKADVQMFMSNDARAGVPAPTRVARLKTLRTIMRDAVGTEAADRDPTAGVPKPTVEQRPPANPDRDTLAAILEACDEQVRLIVLLALDAGLRWGEAAGMSVEAVVLDDGNPRMWVGQVATRSPRGIRGHTKGHRARWVPITTDRLADALRARIATVGTGLLSTHPKGGPISYWVCRDRWAKAREAVGAPLRFHDLRHVFGSDMGNAGVPRRDIATVLGHADEKTTAGYLHGNDQSDIFAAARKAKAAGR